MIRSKSEFSTTLIPKVSSILVIATILAMLPTMVLLVDPLVVYAEEENGSKAMDEMNDEGSDLISPITEWIGFGALAMTVGVVLLLGFNMMSKNGSKGNSPKLVRTKRYLFTLTGALSIAVGVVHLMLVKEHMGESYLWGIGFLAMGIPQILCSVCGISCGIVIIFSKMLSSLTKILCTLGIIANAFFVGIFVYVRLFVPPFSPEGTPVHELEPNGILTVVIQLLIVVILVYLLREKKIKEREITIVRKI
jgi:hypothetical protein